MILRDTQLQEAIALLQARIHPEAIYLFGSQVSGKATNESGDVDLCIVVPDDKEPYREAVDAYESLQDMPFPKDIIVRRKSRFEERATWPSTLEHEVSHSGRLIYSA
jgi:predicted nucleotidyltransferase